MQMKELKFIYIGGSNSNLDSIKIEYGTNGHREVSIYKPYLLSIVDGKLLIIDPLTMTIIAKTSTIEESEWVEDVILNNHQYPLAKVFRTKSGSTYYFTPVMQ